MNYWNLKLNDNTIYIRTKIKMEYLDIRKKTTEV